MRKLGWWRVDEGLLWSGVGMMVQIPLDIMTMSGGIRSIIVRLNRESKKRGIYHWRIENLGFLLAFWSELNDL